MRKKAEVSIVKTAYAILLAVFFVSSVFGFGRLATSAGIAQQKNEKSLIHCPASFANDSRIFSKAAYRDFVSKLPAD